jgi:hypothetical protein
VAHSSRLFFLSGLGAHPYLPCYAKISGGPLSAWRSYSRIRTARTVIYLRRKVVPFSGICTGCRVNRRHILLSKWWGAHINTGRGKNNMRYYTRVGEPRACANRGTLGLLKNTTILSTHAAASHNGPCPTSTLVHHRIHCRRIRDRRCLCLNYHCHQRRIPTCIARNVFIGCLLYVTDPLLVCHDR